MNELLDGSVSILDIYGSTRDVISHYRENVGDLQYALKQGSKSWPSPVRLGRDRYDSV